MMDMEEVKVGNAVDNLIKWFLSKEDMSHKKIQKLAYYAQAWCFTLTKVDIIPGIKFEAWVHGPVSPDIWKILKGFGWRDICLAAEFKSISIQEAEKAFTDEQKDILELVWQNYGEYSADELEAMTHYEDPWKLARNGLSRFDKTKQVITNESMLAFYKNKYHEV